MLRLALPAACVRSNVMFIPFTPGEPIGNSVWGAPGAMTPGTDAMASPVTRPLAWYLPSVPASRCQLALISSTTPVGAYRAMAS